MSSQKADNSLSKAARVAGFMFLFAFIVPTLNWAFVLSKFDVVNNALGEKTVTLINKEMEAGNYEVSFNASTLPSGVYFYRIVAGEFNQTKKLILLK